MIFKVTVARYVICFSDAVLLIASHIIEISVFVPYGVAYK